ncbi:alpha/beta fold hydrolase [Nakamurella sp. YIM 132087]|uniref:Alpha/beta fold hydrolase n=1 Tax=Nakamurella alba TaxID=2665158 RepID=A0A7K1FT55_9ACTN|nr:alpha/beta hydrolase [Nakamurella alba]MTD17270.1 alpha/beta fold hydrolase [Nakamurella alba]
MSFVLVHGAGYGANCWDLLVPSLPGEVLAIDLPGRGTRAEKDLRTTTLDDCAQAVVDDVLARDLTDIVLVGHSFAGVTVPRVLNLIPDRISAVVLVGAAVPPHGLRMLDQLAPEIRGPVEESLIGGLYSITREGAIPMLCNDLDEEQSTWALDRLVDDSAALLSEKVDLSGYERGVPTTWVRTLQDHCVPLDLQQLGIERSHATVKDIDAGHMAMISRPAELAAILVAAAP